jgi:hypothetical protein
LFKVLIKVYALDLNNRHRCWAVAIIIKAKIYIQTNHQIDQWSISQ